MKILFLLFTALIPFLISGQPTNKLHYKSILVDTHNDVLSSSVLDGNDISHRLATGHSDLERWKEGGLDVQFFSVWTGETARNKEGFYKDANQEIDSLYAIVQRNNNRLILAKTFSEVKRGIKQHKLVAL